MDVSLTTKITNFLPHENYPLYFIYGIYSVYFGFKELHDCHSAVSYLHLESCTLYSLFLKLLLSLSTNRYMHACMHVYYNYYTY